MLRYYEQKRQTQDKLENILLWQMNPEHVVFDYIAIRIV